LPELVQPTIWNLSGGGIQVSYSVAGPNLHYHDTTKILDFAGDQIRVTEVPDLGTLVSVTTFLTIDSGSTSFTLFLPRVNLPGRPADPAPVPVSTEGVTTVHHLSLLLPFQLGQQESYTVTPLHGTAA